jgi:outer membrane lipoprotein-sorting protein
MVGQRMSKGSFIAAVVCTAAVAVAPMHAAGVTLDTVIRKVQEQQKKTSTLQADFRQEKELALLSKPEVSTGTFIYAKPNNVLWNYAAPKRVQMLITGGVLTTYYPDLNKAEKIEVKRFEDQIFKYMGASGAIDELGRYFNFTFTDRANEPGYILDLQPKSATIAKRVKHIRIWIDKKTYLTNKVEYTEGDGDVTRYEFTSIKVNEPIDQSRFTLNLPANTRVEQMKIQ